MPEHLKTLGADLHLEIKRFSLLGLWAVAILGAAYGLGLAMRAIGESGVVRNESEGKRTWRLMVVGFVVIALCLALLVAGYAVWTAP